MLPKCECRKESERHKEGKNIGQDWTSLFRPHFGCAYDCLLWCWMVFFLLFLLFHCLNFQSPGGHSCLEVFYWALSFSSSSFFYILPCLSLMPCLRFFFSPELPPALLLFPCLIYLLVSPSFQSFSIFSFSVVSVCLLVFRFVTCLPSVFPLA